jgi:hypothetical protein
MPVASAGDCDGDGFDDVLVGGFGVSTASLYPGNGLFGQNRHFHQENAGGGKLASHSGLATNQFKIGASVRTPWGRQKVRLEWELETLNSPFDGLGIVRGAAFALPAPVPGYGASLEALTPALTANPVGGPPALARPHREPRALLPALALVLARHRSRGRLGRAPRPESSARSRAAAVRPSRARGGRPNPFVAMTSLRFVLAHAGRVELRIVDVRGRLVRRLESSSSPRRVRRSWEGTDLAGRAAPAGVYFAELVTEEGTATTRLVRMR